MVTLTRLEARAISLLIMLLAATASRELLDQTLGLALSPGAAETIVTWALGTVWLLWLCSVVVALLDHISD